MRQIEPNTFICADNAEVLRELPDGFCDLCLTDPPYGIKRFEKGFGYTRFKGYGAEKDGIVWDRKPCDETFLEIRRVSRHQIVWGGNNFILPPTEYFMVWDKAQTVPNFSECEYAWSSVPVPAKVFHYSIHVHNHSEKYHPTQKPVPLFVWCLLLSTKPGDLVIDPFCGSGTTALACHKTGRRFICIDREQKYIEIAQQRYRDLVAQTELFGAGDIESGATSANSASTQNAQVAMGFES